MNKLSPLLFTQIMITSREGRALLMDLRFRSGLLGREWRTGLLMGSIIQNPLLLPDDNSGLRCEETETGKYVSYDFLRPGMFNRQADQCAYRISIGRLRAFPLKSFIKHTPGDYTPIGKVDAIRFEDELQSVDPTIKQLLKWGLIRISTYRAAFASVGLEEIYQEGLKNFGKEEDPVYVVTPKGNGTIFFNPLIRSKRIRL